MATDSFELRLARIEDLTSVSDLVRQFHELFGFRGTAATRDRLLSEIVSDSRLGRLWRILSDGRTAGYAVVVFYPSLEHGGRVALLDEFFILPEFRGEGLGGWVLDRLREESLREGIATLRLEVDQDHPQSERLYARHGFRPDGRALWSLRS